jgi:hypothetical protein
VSKKAGLMSFEPGSEGVIGEAGASLFEFEWLFRTLWRRRVLVRRSRRGAAGGGHLHHLREAAVRGHLALLVKFGREYVYQTTSVGAVRSVARSRDPDQLRRSRSCAAPRW